MSEHVLYGDIYVLKCATEAEQCFLRRDFFPDDPERRARLIFSIDETLPVAVFYMRRRNGGRVGQPAEFRNFNLNVFLDNDPDNIRVEEFSDGSTSADFNSKRIDYRTPTTNAACPGYELHYDFDALSASNSSNFRVQLPSGSTTDKLIRYETPYELRTESNINVYTCLDNDFLYASGNGVGQDTKAMVMFTRYGCGNNYYGDVWGDLCEQPEDVCSDGTCYGPSQQCGNARNDGVCPDGFECRCVGGACDCHQVCGEVLCESDEICVAPNTCVVQCDDMLCDATERCLFDPSSGRNQCTAPCGVEFGYCDSDTAVCLQQDVTFECVEFDSDPEPSDPQTFPVWAIVLLCVIGMLLFLGVLLAFSRKT